MRTASESWAPAAAQTVVRLSRHWRAWSPIDPSTRLPVLGSMGTWPEQKSRPPERTAWLYGPAGLGASGAVTGWRCDTGRWPFGGGRTKRTLVVGTHATVGGRMRVRSALAGLAALVAAGAITTPRADAAIAFAPCAPAGFQCGQLAVPLDPSSAAGGTITLSVKRKPAPSNPSQSAVIGLAGGPGQAAIPFASKIEQNIAPALVGRDLVVYDQRGTGASGQLRCPGTSTPSSCANRIGPARAFYRTAETVEDIEEIRRAGGYAQLGLYGIS